jgi:hypothetical protein
VPNIRSQLAAHTHSPNTLLLLLLSMQWYRQALYCREAPRFSAQPTASGRIGCQVSKQAGVTAAAMVFSWNRQRRCRCLTSTLVLSHCCQLAPAQRTAVSTCWWLSFR